MTKCTLTHPPVPSFHASQVTGKNLPEPVIPAHPPAARLLESLGYPFHPFPTPSHSASCIRIAAEPLDKVTHTWSRSVLCPTPCIIHVGRTILLWITMEPPVWARPLFNSKRLLPKTANQGIYTFGNAIYKGHPGSRTLRENASSRLPPKCRPQAC